MFLKTLDFINNTEMKLKKLGEVTIRIVILALLVITFIMLTSSGFLSAVGTFIVFLMVLAVFASLLYHILKDTKQDGDH